MTDVCEDCQFFYNCRHVKNKEFGYPDHVVTECTQHKSVKELPHKSLSDVHNVFLKWFPGMDVTRIDTRLAHYISNEEPGNPLFMSELTRSGYLKTTLSSSFHKIPKIIELNSLTPAAFVSGATDKKGKSYPDYGTRLTNKNRIAIVKETASLKAMERKEKRQMFAIFKTLHDGYLQKGYGTDVYKLYDNCNTSLWLNSTPDFRREGIILQEIGYCLLCDAIKTSTENDIKEAKQAQKNRKYNKEIFDETTQVVLEFLAHTHLKEFDEDEDFIVKKANRLKYIRATAGFSHSYDLLYKPEVEHPARVTAQLTKLYNSLLSLDKNYSRTTAQDIIERVVNSTGDPALVSVLFTLDIIYWNAYKTEGTKTPFTIPEMASQTGYGYEITKKECELLVGLDILKRGIGATRTYELRYADIDDADWGTIFEHGTL